MDPIIGSTLVKVGGSLLGGLFGKKKTVSAQENSRQGIMGQAQGARQAAAEYGFNPLTLLGVSSAIGPSQLDNTMGQAIADAALLAADSLSGREEDKLRLENMRLENERLKAEVSNLTLRPKVGGVYAGNVMTPNAGNGGQSNENNPMDVGLVSPFSARPVYSYGDLSTPVQSAVKQDVPAFRALGHDFYGSGLFSTAQQVEDSAGDVAQAIWGAVTVSDAWFNEAYKFGTRRRADYEGTKRGGYGFSSNGRGYALYNPDKPAKPVAQSSKHARRSWLQQLGNPFPVQ